MFHVEQIDEGGKNMQERLQEYWQDYQEVMDKPRRRRDYMLADLMTDMEREFRIPMLASQAFNSQFPDVIRLYRTISQARGI